MSNSQSAESNVPPYLSYKTFSNFVNTLKSEGLPDRIDRSLMRNVAGTIQNYLMSCLKYLKLIDNNGVPQENLHKLVQSDTQEYQDTLRVVLETSYPFLFGDRFRLGTATASQFNEKFKNIGVKGETLYRGQLFFLAAAKEAGISISKHIKPTRVSTEESRTTRRTNQKPNKQTTGQTAGEVIDIQPPNQNRQSSGVAKPLSLQDTLVQALYTHASKFPDFNPEWDSDSQKNWLVGWERIADRLMSMLDKIQVSHIESEE